MGREERERKGRKKVQGKGGGEKRQKCGVDEKDTKPLVGALRE